MTEKHERDHHQFLTDEEIDDAITNLHMNEERSAAITKSKWAAKGLTITGVWGFKLVAFILAPWILAYLLGLLSN